MRGRSRILDNLGPAGVSVRQKAIAGKDLELFGYPSVIRRNHLRDKQGRKQVGRKGPGDKLKLIRKRERVE